MLKKTVGMMMSVMVLAGACSASATDFKTLAEETAVEAAQEANPDFTATASCDDPGGTDVGTTFACTVTYNDGDVASATAVIGEGDTVEVTVDPAG